MPMALPKRSQRDTSSMGGKLEEVPWISRAFRCDHDSWRSGINIWLQVTHYFAYYSYTCLHRRHMSLSGIGIARHMRTHITWESALLPQACVIILMSESSLFMTRRWLLNHHVDKRSCLGTRTARKQLPRAGVDLPHTERWISGVKPHDTSYVSDFSLCSPNRIIRIELTQSSTCKGIRNRQLPGLLLPTQRH